MEENKSFPEAIQALLDEKTEEITNDGWNGKDMVVKLQIPDGDCFMTDRYLYIQIHKDARVPWTASQLDMLSKKWKYDLK